MKLYARLADMSDIEYLKNNNMYQTAVKYMSMLNELGLLRCHPWTQPDNGNADDNVATVIAFRQVDADEEDIAITFVNERHRGEVSFIFHENYTGEYNEVRFLSGDWSRGRPRVLLGEI